MNNFNVTKNSLPLKNGMGPMQSGHAVNSCEIQGGGQKMAVMVGIFEENSGEFVLHHP